MSLGPAKLPQVWRRLSGGWSTFFNRAGRQGGHALGRGGKVFLVGANGECGTYDCATHETWEHKGALKVAGAATNKIPTAPWAHSSGALFVTGGLSTDAGSSLYRTTDPAAGWTKVLDIIADIGPVTATGDKVVQMTELDNGWIVAATYGTNDPPDSNNASALIRSKDAGMTWHKLATFDRAYAPRHMHCVVWDPYRSVLWAGGGDGLLASKLCYSTDRGETWRPWAATWQCTGIIPLPRGVILISDHNALSYCLHRVSGVTLDELLAQSFSVADHKAYDPVAQHPLRASLSLANAGFGWWGWHDASLGVTYAAFNSTTYEGVLAASGNEDGAADCPAWQPIAWDGRSWGGDNLDASPPNHYDAQWDGWHYSASDASNLEPMAWRVIPPEFVIHVDQANGRECGRGTAVDPINYWPDEGLPLARRIKLLGNFAGPVGLGRAGTVVDRNGYTLGTAVAGTLTVDEPFTSGSAPTNWSPFYSGSGSLTPAWNNASSPAPHEGAYAVKCVAGAANAAYSYIRRATTGLTSLVNGEDFWLACWAYLDEAAFAGYAEFFNVINHCGVRLKTVADKGGTNHTMLTFMSGDALEYFGDRWAPVDVPLQKWFEFLVRIRASDETAPYRGEVDAWIDGQQALALRGVLTRQGTGGATAFHSFSLGPTNRAAASGVRTWTFDQVRVSMGPGAFDPRKPGAATLYGRRQLIVPDGVSA